jgi:hypothetical protein
MPSALVWILERPRAVLGAFVLFYAVLGLWVLAPEAVYSGDIGVKYVQARALGLHRLASMDIPYPGAFLDPDGEFLPMRPPFLMSTAGTRQAIFSPLSAVSQALVVGVAGMRGLIALSIAGAVAVLWSASLLVPHATRAALLVVIGIGSPLWFYGVSGWEHAPAVALGTAAFALSYRGRGAGAAATAGALLGAGAVLRDEVLLLLPGVLFVLWCRTRTLRPLISAVGAMLIPLLAAAAVEVIWFQRPAAAHLRHAVHLVQRAVHLTDAANPDVPVLVPLTPRDRYDTVVQYWLLGYGNDWLIALGAGGLVLALVLQRLGRSSLALLLWLAGIVALAAGDVQEVVTAPKWVAGLLRGSPYLVFALFPLPVHNTGPRLGSGSAFSGWLRQAVLVTAAAYLAIAIAGVDTTGGKSLGPRLLLPLVPLLAASALLAIEAYLRAPAAIDKYVGVAGVALFLMAVAIHALGAIPAYVARNRIDAKALRSVVDSGERIVVADDEFTAQLLLPLYYRKILLLADTPEGAQRLGTRLAGEHLASLLVVTRSSDTPIDLAPFTKRRSELHGRMTLQFWER